MGTQLTDLFFEPTPDGLFVQKGGDTPIPVSEWTSQGGASLATGVLMRLRDDGDALEHTDGMSLMVAWCSVALLTSNELRCIGLPDAAPFTFEVITNGSIHDDDFRIHYGFLGKGRRVLGVRRQGAWLRVGGQDYVLLEPLFSIADAIDQFNQADYRDLESRMLRWGQIAEMLPDETVVADENLRSLRIVVASSFQLNPFANEDGEPDFDPVVGRRETQVTETGEDEQMFVSALPDARQTDFARRFRRLSLVKHRYAVGGGAFVVLTPDVETALVAVRRAQAGTAAERRDFLQNVSGYLRGALETARAQSGDEGSAGDGAEIDLDLVFSDEGLSERVKGIGLWEEKLLPWIQRAAEPWLPPEALGLRIGDRFVQLSEKDLPALEERIKVTIERGDPTVAVGDGVVVPADSATLAAVGELRRRVESTRRPGGEQRSGEEDGEVELDERDTDDQVLLVIDNLETVGFSRERRRRKPGITAAIPAVSTRLLPHQEEALGWLHRHWDAGSWGALLADDMGLGKTLAALAFLSSVQTHVLEQGMTPRPMLVVAPTGLLRNWQDEHAKHMAGAGLGVVLEAHGRALRSLRQPISVRRGTELALGQPLLDIQVLAAAGWVLTTYETLRDYQHSFGRVRWRAAVFDEAQKIKNPGIRLTEAALAMDIDFALLMTGTPVENRPADIWSILDRAEPGSFGNLKDFSARYESDTGTASTLVDLQRALTQPSAPETPALMLRRLKEDHIATLPEKRLHRRVVEMPPLQAAKYSEAVLDRQRDGRVLQALHRLRSISLHPLPPGDAGLGQYIRESARLAETFAILGEVARRGDKALLFVESREMQNFLIVALRRRFQLPDDVLVINGAVSGRTRKARVDVFQERRGFDVMILSPRAGGVGLTVTAANHVIHLSRWWNPAVEDQCTDRVFRIGQQRTVHVYVPLARHPRFGDYSFDLKLDSLMERKRAMNRRVLAPAAATGGDVQELYRSTMTEASEEPLPVA
ncbi:MAG: DEAD/DEAH box helicase [Gemmatimonadetes bacterium]|nr:DEAD/DEAH box helicase [Gemmatimonadota bacterium]MYH52070.1 DEAD/DEAH box helicase [Gemmatimonadota bacterium]MYK65086.1 DEAD/DEAH box helicase [Gemmatimonadota bacterium]